MSRNLDSDMTTSAGASSDAGRGIKEPQWKLFCIPNSRGRAFAAVVTRTKWRRALKAARREALLSAAESCRERAKVIRAGSERLNREESMEAYFQLTNDADHWDETALWLEERMGK